MNSTTALQFSLVSGLYGRLYSSAPVGLGVLKYAQ
jgi:hypothetical protein